MARLAQVHAQSEARIAKNQVALKLDLRTSHDSFMADLIRTNRYNSFKVVGMVLVGTVGIMALYESIRAPYRRTQT